jgi:hypothetical protein
MAKSGFTTRNDISSVLVPLFELARDVIAITDGRPLKFQLGRGYAHTGLKTFKPSAPGMSAHRRLELEDKLSRNCEDEYAMLTGLFDGVPLSPVAPDITFEYEPSFDDASITFGRFPFRMDADDGEPLLKLTTLVHNFLRINENISMGPQLLPWRIMPDVSDIDFDIWADTAENAVPRAAAMSPELRQKLRSGEMHWAVPRESKVPQALTDCISKRVRSEPPAKHDWVFQSPA